MKKMAAKINVEYPGKHTIEFEQDDLINTLVFSDEDETVEEKIYKDYRLTVKGRFHQNEAPFIVSHYNGYIKHLDPLKYAKTKEIMYKDEVEELVHCGWTGGNAQVGIGFDCAHAGDAWLSLDPVLYMAGVPDYDLVKLYSFWGVKENDTFKSREYLFDMLQKVADKTENILRAEELEALKELEEVD